MTSDSPMWRAGPPASEAALAALAAAYPDLPDSYLAFLRVEDGSGGDLGVEPGWVEMWPAADVAGFNAGYEVPTWLPGFVGFASNGGGELLAFDTRRAPWLVVMVPFIPLDEDEAIEIASDFATLTRHFGIVIPD